MRIVRYTCFNSTRAYLVATNGEPHPETNAVAGYNAETGGSLCFSDTKGRDFHVYMNPREVEKLVRLWQNVHGVQG